MKLLHCLSAALLTVLLGAPAFAPAYAIGSDDLPDIGSPAEATISLDDEYRIGLSVLREIRNADQVLEDPEVTQYIDTVGHRLSSDAQDGKHRFHFVVVKDPTINAFAVPGGFIFVNSGLILATRNESELAGVLAHEISHVTQRHLVRSLLEQRRASLASTAALLAAILLGATHGGAGGDIALAGIFGSQTLALAQQMSFSRDMESEADRVGMGVLARAGFDPNGMPNFFEVIARVAGRSESTVPAIVMSHPVTSERIAEARARVAELGAQSVTESVSYAITRERVRVLSTPAGESAVSYYTGKDKNNAALKPTDQYGEAIAFINAGEPARAVPLLRKLTEKNESIVQYHAALGQAEAAAGDKAALATFERAMKLFPRDVTTTVRYADALLRFGEPKEAHDALLELFNAVEPTPAQVRQLALLANAAGDVGDAYYYMSEYHIMSGDLALAANQLQLALSVPKLTNVQQARFRARLDEIRAAMPRRLQRQQPANPSGGH